MKSCEYCGKSVSRAGTDRKLSGMESQYRTGISYRYHDTCHDEWQRRTSDGICSRCGTNKTGPAENGLLCSDCKWDTPFSGYSDS